MAAGGAMTPHKGQRFNPSGQRSFQSKILPHFLQMTLMFAMTWVGYWIMPPSYHGQGQNSSPVNLTIVSFLIQLETDES